ncbi:MAG: hypothetical protein IJ859_00615 [Synergistaceae bacterium]|nr:hypothetical protein [Synergistaceae bacterium]
MKQLLESLSSLPINDEDIKEKVKNKNPLFSTQREYDLKKPFELGVGYWGSVVDNAQHVANIGSEQEKNIALMMLRMAEEAITGAEKTPTPATIEAHNGENSSYSVNVMNNGTMRGGG